MMAEMMRRAAEARSLPGLFGQLEEAGIMLRIDRSVTATMAKAPTFGLWELDRCAAYTSSGAATCGSPVPAGSSWRRARLRYRRRAGRELRRRRSEEPAAVPIWGSDVITLQPIRAGFPVRGRSGRLRRGHPVDDAEKNRLVRRPRTGTR